MKAYTKTIKGLCPLTQRTKLATALQYALFGLSLTGHAHAQQDSQEPVKRGQPERNILSAEGETPQQPAAEAIRSEEKASPAAKDAQRVVAEPGKGSEAVLPTMVIREKGVQEGYGTKGSMVGTKTRTPIIEIPQSMSVITRNELDMRAVNLNFT